MQEKERVSRVHMRLGKANGQSSRAQTLSFCGFFFPLNFGPLFQFSHEAGEVNGYSSRMGISGIRCHLTCSVMKLYARAWV